MIQPATLLGLLCLATSLSGQAAGQPQKAWKDTTLRDFRAFDAETQDAIVRRLERKVQLDPNAEIQRIVSMQRSHDRLPIAEPPPHHLAADWARGVAPTRELIRRDDKRHVAVRERIPAVRILPDLHRALWYDWGAGAIVRRRQPLSTQEKLENLYHGYPPGSDDALARLLQTFDNDPRMRPLAHYFSHLYADLEAKVYEDVTLYEAWYSGATVHVPDVDAIPFERRILKTRKFRSPIPKSKARTALYQRIREHALEYRKYRTLREAAAIAFLRADPAMDPTYRRLVPRFHYLYLQHGDDPAAIARLLAKVRDREALIGSVDRKILAAPTEHARREARAKSLRDMRAWLRYYAQVAVFEQKKRKAGGGRQDDVATTPGSGRLLP